MPKTSIEPTRHALNGATMGTRWSAVVFARPGHDIDALQVALQGAVDAVDAQMSTWRADSDLMRLNAAPVGAWCAVPPELMQVLDHALTIGRATNGAFDISMGDAVQAWGFGSAAADVTRIQAARARKRQPAFQTLALNGPARMACRQEDITLDLSGIAKGYGVDCLAEVLLQRGLTSGLVSIDGEVRAIGPRPDGTPWPVAVERPDPLTRAAHSVLALEKGAVATSGDYRHRVQVGRRSLSHTMDPRTGAPLTTSPASVTVWAETCMAADAMATALMVMGVADGRAFALLRHIDALFLTHDNDAITAHGTGPLFGVDAQA